MSVEIQTATQNKEEQGYSLEYWGYNGSSGQPDTATVCLLLDGKLLPAGGGRGKGPVEALFSAIDKITNNPATLRRYQLRNLGDGLDSIAHAYVLIEHDSKGYEGVGEHPNINVASMLAYIAAINKIHKNYSSADEHKQMIRASDS